MVLKKDAGVAELLAHCRERLADFKVPKVLHLVKGLPKGPTGKVQRRHLAAFFDTGTRTSSEKDLPSPLAAESEGGGRIRTGVFIPMRRQRNRWSSNTPCSSAERRSQE